MDSSFNKEYLDLIKKIAECKNYDDLKTAVEGANDFIRTSKLKTESKEYKKLVTLVELVKLKLKKRRKENNESTLKKNFLVSESQYKFIKQLVSEISSQTQKKIDDIIDQISSFGEESLSPSQKKFLKSFSSGEEIDVEKPRFRDRMLLKFEKKIPNLPKIIFTLMETFETDDGFEYLGDLEFNGNEYTGFFIVDEKNIVESIEFENLETNKDLFEECEGLEKEIVFYFDEIADKLSEEDLESDIY